ncbi:MAG TPA: quinol:electron acceptor oxidoreductase subunit ActD [Bryobacteraceae bacterium]|nr:quinol:electron acceptor oxidoreductase subunit ActD [Bryobacteraceae bacterium]
MFVAADFPNREAVLRAILELKAKGFTSADVAVFSDEPVPLPRGVLERPSHMSLVVVTGAITLCLLTIGFIYFTQYNYPITTGGMPIFSFWATGVIFYELTMFGAIVTTFFWFLRESGLLRRRRRHPTPAINPDTISLRVECEADRTDTARQALEAGGAANFRALGDAR